MKIVKIKTFVLHHELSEPFAFSQWWHKARQACVIKIETDEGIHGWGEANVPAEAAAVMVNSVFAPLLLAQDPLQTHPLWQKLYVRAKVFGQGGISMGALSAVDIALWDIKAQYLGVPIYHLLGGQFRTHVQAYATGFFLRPNQTYPEAFVEEAHKYIADGFGALKMKMGLFGRYQQDIENVEAIRCAVANEQLPIMVDANGAFEEFEAIKVGKALEELNVRWFEEPVPKSNLRGYIHIRNKIQVPIATGESLIDSYQFRPWLAQGALDIAQPDICKSGGFTECQKILALARSWDTMVIPHIWGTNIAMAAALQFIAAIPEYPESLSPPQMWFEFDRSPSLLREAVVKDPIKMESGFIKIPQGPGLGIEVNEEFLQSHNIVS